MTLAAMAVGAQLAAHGRAAVVSQASTRCSSPPHWSTPSRQRRGNGSDIGSGDPDSDDGSSGSGGGGDGSSFSPPDSAEGSDTPDAVEDRCWICYEGPRDAVLLE